MKLNLTIRQKLLVLVMGINVLFFTALAVINAVQTSQAVMGESQQKAMALLDGVKSDLNAFFNQKSSIAWTLSHNPEIVSFLADNEKRQMDVATDSSYAGIINYLDKLVKEDGDIRSAFIASERARFYWDNNNSIVDPNYNVTVRPWYQAMKAAGHAVWDVSVDYSDGNTYVNYRCPVFDANGQFLGGCGLDVTLEKFGAMLQSLQVFADSETFLVGDDGLLLYHPNTEWVIKKKIQSLAEAETASESMISAVSAVLAGKRGHHTLKENGRERVWLHVPLSDLNWSLVLNVPSEEMTKAVGTALATSRTVGIAGLLLMAVILWLIARSIVNPIDVMVNLVEEISQGEGDLTKRLEMAGTDELSRLGMGFDRFIEALHNIIAEVRDNANRVTSATNQLNVTVSQMAAGIEEQSVQASEVASAVQQMTAAIVQNSENAAQTAQIAGTANEKAEAGTEAIRSMKSEMDLIVASSEKTGGIVGQLSSRAEEIGAVVQMINDIADQTNLLALNAAIEAARAGEQGRGFAVVADEVRKLAERTTNATKDIEATIQAIQLDTAEAEKAIQDSTRLIDSGRDATRITEQSLNEIVASVQNAMAMVQQIAAASEEMSVGASEISRNVEAISMVTRESAGGANEIRETTEFLNQETVSLATLVGRFRLMDA